MSLTLRTSVLFISLLQLTNRAQSLSITLLFLLSICLPAASSPAPLIVILLYASTYASLQSIDFSIEVLKLISLLVLYTPLD